MVQTFGAHQQHTLQQFKNMILSKKLNQNLPKSKLFFEKNCKICHLLGAFHPQTLVLTPTPAVNPI